MRFEQHQRLYSKNRRYDYLTYDRCTAKDKYTQDERLEIHRRVRETALSRLVRRIYAREDSSSITEVDGAMLHEEETEGFTADSPVSVDMSSIDMGAVLKTECRHSEEATNVYAVDDDTSNQYDLFIDSYLSFN